MSFFDEGDHVKTPPPPPRRPQGAEGPPSLADVMTEFLDKLLQTAEIQQLIAKWEALPEEKRKELTEKLSKIAVKIFTRRIYSRRMRNSLVNLGVPAADVRDIERVARGLGVLLRLGGLIVEPEKKT